LNGPQNHREQGQIYKSVPATRPLPRAQQGSILGPWLAVTQVGFPPTKVRSIVKPLLPRFPSLVYDGNIQAMIDWVGVRGFDWDDGNSRKSTDKHGVSQAEAEQVFFNHPLLVAADPKHSVQEQRYHALGVTDDGRRLHISFTLRAADTLIRVISARDMHRKERAVHDQTSEDPT